MPSASRGARTGSSDAPVRLMPRLDRDPAAAGPIVQGFAQGGFRVAEIVYRGGLWLTPVSAQAWDAPALDMLTAEDLGPLIAARPEFVLLGTGPTLRRPPPALGAALEARGIGVEAMDSRAAARAWGLLRGEGRQIAAALLPL